MSFRNPVQLDRKFFLNSTPFKGFVKDSPKVSEIGVYRGFPATPGKASVMNLLICFSFIRDNKIDPLND